MMKDWQVSARMGLVVGLAGGLLQVIAAVASVLIAQPVTAQKQTSTKQPITAIPRTSELKQLLMEAKWLTQALPPPEAGKAQVAQITAVQLKPTDQGLEVILETTGTFDEVLNSETENSLITDIPNAQLRLPKGGAFRQDNPTQDIASVEVTNLDAKILRVTVTGKAGVPTAEVSQSSQALILSVAAPPAPAQPTPAPTTPPAAPGLEPQQPAAPAAPTPPPQAEEELLQLEVRAEEEGGYNAPDATTATKTDTPIRDIPQSIQVVPQQVLKDQQVTRLGEALKNVPGVARGSQSSRSPFDFYLIRGFLSRNVLRDGLLDTVNFSIGSDTANVERLEVLKGPSSVLYGPGLGGGLISLITKQPLEEPYYSLEGSAGSFDFYRGTTDLSGPLNDSKTVLYRLNAAAQTSGSFIDFFESERYFVAPVLSWQISDRTKLSVEGEYLYAAQPFDQGIPAVGSVLPNPNGEIPRSRYVGEPGDEERRQAYRIGYNFEHRFSDTWQVRSALRGSFFLNDYSQAFDTGVLDDRTVSRTFGISNDYYNLYNLDNYVVGEFATGEIQHQLVAGLDLSRNEVLFSGFSRSIAPLDLFDPVYSGPFGPLTDPTKDLTIQDKLGIYIQDQITLAENLKLLLGGRFDIASQKDENFIASTTTFQQDEAFSPRVGIVYQPIPAISLYASYNRGFQPVIGRSADDTQFRPERSTQYEVGVKADLNDQISATLAFYNLARSNVLVADTRPDVPPGFSIQTGEQRSRGIELDVTGEILPGWNIIAGYAYTDAQVTEDTNPELVDNRLNNVPKNAFNVWTTYEIQQGTLQGLGFGAGLFFVGDREGDLANTFQLPSYLRTDAAIFYRRDQFRAALNIRNLFNVDYFESSQSQLRVFPGDPFTVQGTVSWEF